LLSEGQRLATHPIYVTWGLGIFLIRCPRKPYFIPTGMSV